MYEMEGSRRETAATGTKALVTLLASALLPTHLRATATQPCSFESLQATAKQPCNFEPVDSIAGRLGPPRTTQQNTAR